MKTPAIVAFLSLVSAAAAATTNVTDGIRYFANPAAAYYQDSSNITNLAARCCSRIKAIDGRLYIGLGNYTYNTGPTPVLALSPQTGAVTNEYSAGTEAIDDFKVFSNGKVYVPSLDPREASSSILGHFFIRSSTGDGGTWSRNRGIPAGVVHNTRSDTYIYTHCWDLAEFDGKIHFAGYGTASATLSGNSMGTFSDTCPAFDINEMQIVLERFASGKWQYKTRNSTDLCRLYSFLEVDGALYAMQNNKFAPGYDGSLLTNLLDNSTLYATDTYLWRYSPSTGQFSRETNSWDRILPSTGFDDALFMDTSYSRPISTPVIVERTLKTSTGKSYYIATLRYRPLGVYRATISSADGKLSSQKIDLGADTWPADIIEADGKVRILAFSFDSASTTNIVNKVFESTDGVSFSECYRFNHRQMAAAFEYLDNTYYFGFGMGSGSGYTHPAATNHVVSSAHNGEIWKLSLSSQPDDPPGPGPDDPPDPVVETDYWTYNPTAGTITDGVWTFNATVSGSNMTVGTCVTYPSSLSTLDFAKPVVTASGTAYTIKTLNTAMVTFSVTGGKPETSTAKPEALVVGELRLPETGLTSIGQGAFCRTANCTNIVNYLPDSVTSVGNSAFAYCGARQDLFLRGLIGKTGRGIFYSSKIKSITFGAGFKGVGDISNKMASFQGCSGITNLVFSPESSGVFLTNNAFACSCTLSQPLVLYGVTVIQNAAFSGCKIPSITFDKGIETIGTLSGVTTLREVHFLGAPPSDQTGIFADYGQATTVDVTTYVRRKYGNLWLPYSANGEINMVNTTFSSTYATNPAKRKLLFVDKLPGFYVQIK